MSHKTLVNGTAYDVSGGAVLVEGTTYSVKDGNVSVGGTSYNISFILPPAVIDMWGSDYSVSSPTTENIKTIIYANGLYVVGGTYTYRQSPESTTTLQYARIGYSTSLNGNWTYLDKWGGTSTTNSINDIFWDNENWVVTGQSGGASVYTFSNSLSSDWDLYRIQYTNTTSYMYINKIVYEQGYYIATGHVYYVTGSSTPNTYACIAYTTSISSGQWVFKTLWGGPTISANDVYDIIYANGMWLAVGIRNAGDAYCAYSTSLTGSWNMKIMWTGSDNPSYCKNILYVNGMWVGIGKKGYLNSAEIVITYTSDLTGDWTLKPRRNNPISFTDLFYQNGTFIYSDCSYSSPNYYTYLYYTNDVTGSWNSHQIWSSQTNQSPVNTITTINNYWLVGGSFIENNLRSARLSYATTINELL